MLGRVVPGGSRRFPSWFPEPVPRFPSLIGNREPEPPSGTTSPRNHLAGHSVAFVLRLTGEDPAAIFEFQLAPPPQIFEVGGSRLLSHLEERPEHVERPIRIRADSRQDAPLVGGPLGSLT